MTNAFTNNPKLQEAILLIEKMPTGPLMKIASRILITKATVHDSSLRTDDSSSIALRFFSKNDVSIFISQFAYEASEIDLLVQVSLYVFETALYQSLNQAVLVKQLVEGANMKLDYANVFGAAWAKHGPKYVAEQKRQSTLGGPLMLKQVNSQLQIKLADNTLTKQKQLNCLMEFKLVNSRGEPADTITTEMTQHDLYEFFQKLEQIQDQIDELS
mmetsp:Transcript_2417/g.3513  ORF Transcript_2417/g.3513 Transcript_2417/m.3513 type:complete len:215 (+) Transcript_2417:1503-2147(+)